MIKVYGNKSGGHTPKEDPNTLQAGSIAQIVDLICEGPIEGPANNDDWEESTYYNETQVKDEDGNYNFKGVAITGVKGLPYASQNPIKGFDNVKYETTVNTNVTKDDGAISRTITDLETDDVKITIELNGLAKTEKDGDLVKTSVNLYATITPDGGFETASVLDMKISGKTTSTYRKQYTISNIVQYGNGPWTIKVYRTTDDSDSQKLINATKWFSYTVVKHVRLAYPDSVVVGHEIDAKYFGNSVPSRAFKIKGLHIKYPSNYNPVTRNYAGVWNGTFSTGYCNNPAWVVYDLLTNPRYGCGDKIDADMVDKYALYTIGQYCDGINELGNYVGVEVVTKYRNADGTYDSATTYEPRFTFNGVIATREQALAAIIHLCSVFRGFPIWSTGFVSFVQDAPKEISRVASPSNVKDGMFEYTGTPRQARHTAIRVSYNNPENFSKNDVITIEDEAGIRDYGYNPMDITAIGCNSRSEATRRGKYVLYTDINQTETVTFEGGIEWADALPGEVIGVQDPDYSLKSLSGRIVSATANSVTLDRNVVLQAGVTYTLYVQIAHDTDSDDDVDEQILTRELTNSAGTTKTLTWTTVASYVPKADSVFVLNGSNISADVREFVILSVKESGGVNYTVTAVQYNINKYAEIEDGLIIEGPPALDIPSGKLSPPSNISIQPFTYTEGDSANRKYGLLISWIGSDDPRTEWYDIEYREGDEPYALLKSTAELSYDWRNVSAGTFDFRIKGRSITLHSAYAYYNDFSITATVGGPLPPTNLRTNEGGDEFSGKDCHILWDASDGSSYSPDDNTGVLIIDSTSVGDSNVVGYKVEVYTVADVLLRTTTTASKHDKEFIYTYEMNMEDNAGLPIRQIKFKVYTMDLYGETSTAATLVAENPAPDMSSTLPVVTPRAGYLEVEWAVNSDNDMDYYQVYLDTNATPTTAVAKVIHPENRYEYFNVEYGTVYYVTIVPYDLFGVGIGSQIPGGATPLLIPNINVDIELTNSIVKTYSDGTNYVGDIEELYDRVINDGGITIANPSGEYIQYQYSLKDFIDRIAVWTANANPKVYFSYSYDNITFNYLKAESDHTVPSNGILLAATNQSDAVTNYWQLETGFNYALWPNNITAKFVRMYFVNTNSTTIYEFIPSRIIIAELAAIEHLSSISANIGNIIAGVLQSSDYSANLGFKIDLDDKSIYLGGSSTPIMKFWQSGGNKYLDITAAVTFRSGSTGYSNIGDKPTSLNDINATEYGKVSYPNTTGNLLRNSTWEAGSIGWIIGSTAGSSTNTFGVDLNADWQLTNSHTGYVRQLDANGDPATDYTIVHSDPIPVVPGTRYSFSAYVGTHRCDGFIFFHFYDSANTLLTSKISDWIRYDEGYGYGAYQGGRYLNSYKRLHCYDTAPANAAYAKVVIRKYATGDTFTSSYLFFTRALFCVIPSTETSPPDWTSSNTEKSHLTSASDLTKIDGGNIYVGSTIRLGEGGSAIFGNQNVIINTTGNHGSIVVAPDGGPTSNSYCHIDQGDIRFYYWNGSTHLPYNSMTRIETGVANSNSWITIPGVWKETPKIMVTPHTLQAYNKNYASQDQTLKCFASNLSPSGYTYVFLANAQLVLAAGTTSGNGGGTNTSGASPLDTAQITLAANTRSMTAKVQCRGWKWDVGKAVYVGGSSEEDPVFSHYTSNYWHAKYTIVFWYWISGVWYSQSATDGATSAGGYNQVKEFTFTLNNQTADITYYLFRMTVTGWDSVVTNVVNTGNTKLAAGQSFTVSDLGYSSNLVGATVLANGSLNWLAIGR